MKFKNVYYDYKNNKMHHWYVDDDGSNRHEIFTPKIEYYVKDPTGTSEIYDIYGTPVCLQTTSNRFELTKLKTAMTTYESDCISEEMKFLQKRYKDVDLKVDLNDFQIGTIDIESQTENEFKIENVADYTINLISIHLSKQNQVYTFGIYPYTGKSESVQNYYYIPDEKRMLTSFIKFFRKYKCDILVGWNVNRYDLTHIIKRCERLGIDISMSPVGRYREKSNQAGYHVDGGGYEIFGISILDGMDLYKNFEREKRQSYSLDAIGKIEVGEGKLDYEGTINDLWKYDWNKFVEYNVQDVFLTKKINDKKRYIELTINTCYQSLVPFEKIVSSINVVTGYMTRYLHNNNMVLPDKSKDKIEREKLPGAFVMAMTGSHKYCMNFDVQSMYPNLIINYNISPETLVLNPKNTEGLIKTPVEGVYYRKDKMGILPQIVDRIFNERLRFKQKQEICYWSAKSNNMEDLIKNTKFTKEVIIELQKEIEIEKGDEDYYDRQQYIRKILINSMFGDLGNQHFIFFNMNNAKVITMGGQSIIKFLAKSVNDYFKTHINYILDRAFGLKVDIKLENDIAFLIDTDSNYLTFEEIIEKAGIVFANDEEFRQWCYKLDSIILEPFYEKILKIYFKNMNVDRILNFKKEKIMTQVIALAKKKYAMKIIDKEGKVFEPAKLAFTGIEIVRTDTPLFCRKKLKEVVDCIFDTNDRVQVTNKMFEIKQQYIQATYDDIALARGVKNYTKYAQEIENYIEKGLEYPKAVPIHVRASMNYNYMIKKYNLPLMPITDGTKMRYVFVYSKKNELRQNVIGFIGKWPKVFDEYFEIDNEETWNKTFQNVIQRFFDVLQWDEINLDYCGISMDLLLDQEGGYGTETKS